MNALNEFIAAANDTLAWARIVRDMEPDEAAYERRLALFHSHLARLDKARADLGDA